MLKISPVVRRDTTIPTLTLNIVTKGKIMKERTSEVDSVEPLGGSVWRLRWSCVVPIRS